ncbi:MAG: SDR family NAD(P)-dependent oxidoreductase [bacterium]
MKNRVVLITGASQGMGYAIAEGFAKEDAAVVMSARREDVLASAAATIRKKTGDVVWNACLNLFDLIQTS